MASVDMAGYRTIVVSVPQDALDRPMVRFFTDPKGVRIEPFDADLREYPDVILAGV